MDPRESYKSNVIPDYFRYKEIKCLICYYSESSIRNPLEMKLFFNLIGRKLSTGKALVDEDG